MKLYYLIDCHAGHGIVGRYNTEQELNEAAEKYREATGGKCKFIVIVAKVEEFER